MVRPVKIKKLDAKQRLIVITIVGLLVFIVALYRSDIAQQVTIDGSLEKKNLVEQARVQAAPAAPVLPKGYNTPAVKRDPFSLPPEMQTSVGTTPSVTAAVNSNGSANRSNGAVKTKDPIEDFKLTGIAGAGSKRLAVIRSGNNSRPYQLNERLGDYKLIAINEESVVLVGPTGERMLYLERSTQKGGNVIAK